VTFQAQWREIFVPGRGDCAYLAVLYLELLHEFFSLHEGWSCPVCCASTGPIVGGTTAAPASPEPEQNASAAPDQNASAWNWSSLDSPELAKIESLLTKAKAATRRPGTWWKMMPEVLELKLGSFVLSPSEKYCNLKVTLHGAVALQSDSNAFMTRGLRVIRRANNNDSAAEEVFIASVTSCDRKHHHKLYFLTGRPSPLAEHEILTFHLTLATDIGIAALPASDRTHLTNADMCQVRIQALAALPALIVDEFGTLGLDTLEKTSITMRQLSFQQPQQQRHLQEQEQEQADRAFAEQVQRADSTGSITRSRTFVLSDLSAAEVESLQARVAELQASLTESEAETEELREVVDELTAEVEKEKKKKKQSTGRGPCNRAQCTKNRKFIKENNSTQIATPAKGTRRRLRSPSPSPGAACRQCPAAKRQKTLAQNKASDLERELEVSTSQVTNLQAQVHQLTQEGFTGKGTDFVKATGGVQLEDVSRFLVAVNESQQKFQSPAAASNAVDPLKSITAMTGALRKPTPTTPTTPVPKAYTFSEVNQFFDLIRNAPNASLEK
jgi:hypothetical protein